MVTKEYRCTAHDHEFESDDGDPRCPYGCSPKYVVREFRTPFAIGSAGARTVDKLQTQLAADYGLTDMRNDRDSSVMSQTRRESGGARIIGSGRVQNVYQSEQIPQWAPSIFRPQQGWARTGKVPSFDFDSTGFKGGPKAIIRDKHGAIAAAAPSKPQLDIAKNALRRNTVVEKRWDGK